MVAGLASAARRLSSGGALEVGLVEALSTVGDAALVDHAFVWVSRQRNNSAEPSMPQLVAEWWRPRIPPADGGMMDGVPPGWQPPADPSATVSGPIGAIGDEWRPFLSAAARSAVVAAVALPDGTGWVGVEDVWTERAWSADEVHVVRTFAAIVGLALAREEAVEGRRVLAELARQIPAVLYIDEVTGDDIENCKFRPLYVSPQVATILGIEPEEWTKDVALWRRRVHPDDAELAERELAELLGRSGTLVREYRIVRPDTGGVVWVRDDCSIVGDDPTKHRIIEGVIFDISDRKVLEDRLRAMEAKRATTIEPSPPVVLMEPLGEAVEPAYVSSSVEALFGCSREEWLESEWWVRHLYPDDREEVLAARRSLLERGETARMEYRMTVGFGNVIWVSEVAQVVRAGGSPWMLHVVLEDVTRMRSAEEELAYRASHDTLTGLPNRATFEEHLQQALARAIRKRLAVSVLFVDIDGFSQVNALHGRGTGDEVLREVSRRLLSAVRETDIVARRGGDEFLVLLADIEPGPSGWPDGNGSGRDPVSEVADMVTERVREALSTPVLIGDAAHSVSASVGRSIYPLDASDFRTLMAKAGAAMYSARSRFQLEP